MNTTTNIVLAGMLLAGLAKAFGQPAITSQPQNQTALIGETATFSVGATGAPPLHYQWRSHANAPTFTNIPFGTEATLVLTNVQPTPRRFAVVVTDAGGLSGTSSPLITLTVLTPPTVTPAKPTASLFADVTLFATNGSAAPQSFQWLFNGEPIAGAVTNRLMVTNIQKTNVGNYAIVATYAFGSATSQVATLKIVPFNSMYYFGFSWTDTHNCTWDPTMWYQNRACNGPMWPEFLSTNLGLAYAESNNFAFCRATAVDVLNQVAGFPALPKPQLSLYCLWAGDSDFLRAFPPDGRGLGYLNVTNEVAWNGLIQTIILSNSNAVNRLYTKGARVIVTENLHDFSKLPGTLLAFGTNSVGLSKLTEYIARFNAGFIDVMNVYGQTRPDLRILSVDVFSKLNDVLANPTQYGFTQTTVDALGDTNLANKSFTGPGADYAFWDRLHVTSKLNALFAAWHFEVLTNSILEKLEVIITGGSPNIQMNRLLIGRDYTLQSSSDLTHWQDIQAFTAAAGTNQVTRVLNPEATSVFYRLQWQP